MQVIAFANKAVEKAIVDKGIYVHGSLGCGEGCSGQRPWQEFMFMVALDS